MMADYSGQRVEAGLMETEPFSSSAALESHVRSLFLEALTGRSRTHRCWPAMAITTARPLWEEWMGMARFSELPPAGNSHPWQMSADRAGWLREWTVRSMERPSVEVPTTLARYS